MNMKEFLTGLKEKLASLSMGQKVGILSLLGLGVAVFVVTLMWTLAPNYQYLFTDLSDTDASLIVQNLKENRIPYKLTNGGTAVMVPESKVYETRLELAGKGLPKGKGGKGFSLFDETGFSTSEFIQKIDYQRALQDELAKTIMSLDEVDYARVHLVLPKDSVFVEDEKPAKASVVIRPRPGLILSPEHVQGIVYLVAKSVRGLEPENISIIDNTGKVLYEGKTQDNAVLANNRLEIRRAIESSLEKRSQDMLDKILGPGKAVVKVSADVNMDMVKSVKDTYDPDSKVVRSEQISNESSPQGPSVGGVAGVQANIPTGRGTPGMIAPGNTTSTSNIVRNYEISRNKVELVQSPGEIKRLTVSVIVDGNYKTSKDGKKLFVQRSEEEMKEIEDAVKHAVGFNVDRDDSIAVSCMPFKREVTEVKPASIKDKIMDHIVTIIKIVVFLLVTILVFMFIVRPAMKWMTSPVRVLEGMAETRKSIQGEEPGTIEGEERPQIETAVAKSEEMKQAVHGRRKEIEAITKDNMESATAVIRSWLKEGA
ncbi:MAG: flagellar M-ring protein FliF [Deltaproteobacteria bacterium]|nr:MAG: flagellar M-ring protein FliF [Deltaproteobacteria bacterium]